MQSVLGGASIATRWLVRGFVPGNTYAAADGEDSFVWNNGAGALTYTGFGAAMKISLPAQDAQSKVNAATLQLSGTDPAVLTGLFVENYRAQPAEIAFLAADPTTGAPAEEIIVHAGLMDVAAITDQPIKSNDPTSIQQSTLSLTISPPTVDLKRASGRYATDSDQRLNRDANDGIFKDVALVGLSQINWGIAGTSSPVQAATAAGAFNPLAGLNGIGSLPLGLPR